MKLVRMLACSCALVVALGGRAEALTNTEWVKRIYADLLQRSPTSQEVASAVGFLETTLQANPDQLPARMAVAFTLVRSDEWIDNLIGANPFLPGYSQALLTQDTTTGNAAYYRCQFTRFAWADEQIIASIINDRIGPSCVSNNGTFNFPTTTWLTYAARAQALNPALVASATACGTSPANVVIDQIYQDLLGRHASLGELNLPGSDNDQIQGTLLAMGMGGTIGAPQELEYLMRMVRSAFLRFFHRLPSELPNTAPNGNSELLYFVEVSRSVTYRNEWFYALLVSLPEYDTSVPQVPPVVNQMLVNIAAANVLVSAPSIERLGSPPPLVAQVISPLFLNGIVTTSNASVATLSGQVQLQQQAITGQQLMIDTQQQALNAQQRTITTQQQILASQQQAITAQQQTITALAVDAFGGPDSRAAAEAMIATAKAKLHEAEGLVCPLAMPCTDRAVLRARAALALAQEALDSSNFDEAERYAKVAWQSAQRAEARR